MPVENGSHGVLHSHGAGRSRAWGAAVPRAGKEVESGVWKRRPSAILREGDEFSVTLDANAGEVLVSLRGAPDVVMFRGLAGLPLHICVCVVGIGTSVRIRRAWSRPG